MICARWYGLVDGTARNAFSDDDGTSAEDAINEAVALRMLRDNDDGTFRPDHIVRRDQAASVLSRLVRVLVHRSLLKDRPIPPFAAGRTPLPDEMRRQMTGTTWRSGCPVRSRTSSCCRSRTGITQRLPAGGT